MKKVLLVYDAEGWAWHGMAAAIRKYAPAPFDVAIGNAHDWENRAQRLAEFDAVLWFSWTHCPMHLISSCRQFWSCVASHGCQYPFRPLARRLLPSVKWSPEVVAAKRRNLDAARARLGRFHGLIAINRSLAELAREMNPNAVYVPSGIDHLHWSASEIPSRRPLRIGWCGQTRTKDRWHNPKGYCQILLPLHNGSKAVATSNWSAIRCVRVRRAVAG